MYNQIITIFVSLLLGTTLMISANPAVSIEKQRRAISFLNTFKSSNSFCVPVLCYAPCVCGSYLDTRGCDTCSCLSCDGSEWPLA